MAAQKIWWGTWPGALALGLLSLLLALPGALAGLIVLTIPDTGGAGVDFQVDDIPLWHRIFAVIALVAVVVLPILTTRWARKAWLGYVLLGSALSFLVGAVGLGLFGIL
ncbi:hypothetical protein [Tessaracoccus massiliensis]|uniref:hypothetical protein n=1 Tax=Tessaracoccus massiliensis TaxID=1522311 RepID=UPI00058F0FE5|nr:hypothetical protein [Tessaracoccus massiliensis]